MTLTRLGDGRKRSDRRAGNRTGSGRKQDRGVRTEAGQKDDRVSYRSRTGRTELRRIGKKRYYKVGLEDMTEFVPVRFALCTTLLEYSSKT